MRRIAGWYVAGAICLAASPAASQQILQTIDGVAGDDHLGWANSGLGDVNKDGFPDLLVGAPDYNLMNEPDAGLARVYSGKDLTVLWSQSGIDANDRFGQFVSEAGDVNKDGWPDFLVSAVSAEGPPPTSEPNVGSCELRSGKDFTILYKWYGVDAFDNFGDSSAPVGDVNADGWIDVAVGGRGNDGNGVLSGFTRVFSGVDGSVLFTIYGDGPGWLSGSAISAAGDLNHDGHADFIIGSRGASPNGLTKAGQATVYSGLDGSQLFHVDGLHAFDGLGSGVAGLGDVDKDGTDDLAIGIWQSAEKGPITGSARIISGATHATLFAWVGEHAGAIMGVWVDSAGDANRDGWLDVVIGAEGTNVPNAFAAGKVYVFSGKDGSKLFDVWGDFEGDRLGTVVANALDVNQDGYNDVISGAYWNDFGGHDTGTARVYSGCAKVWSQVGAGLPGSNGLPNLAACGVMAGLDKITLKLINAAPFKPAPLVVGLSQVNMPFHGGVMVPAPDTIVIGAATNASGGVELDSTWPDGIPAGVSVVMQFWVPDLGAPAGWSASNGVTATTP
jgi:hypothetical protein